jgi:hypothetical protein
MHKYSTGLIAFIALLSLSGGQALAEIVDCTSIASVNVSHFVTHNNEYGGHLNAHVRGQTPPAGYSQNGRTLFNDYHDWEDAYAYLSHQDPALQCNTSAPVGSEAARTLPLQFFSYQCTAANAHGVCTAGNAVQTHTVTFVLRVVPNGSQRRWIVFNAYPRPAQ